MNTQDKPKPTDIISLTVKDHMEISVLVLDFLTEKCVDPIRGLGLLATFYIPLWLRSRGYTDDQIREALEVMVNRVIAEDN